MQTDKKDMKVEKSVSMHSHALERPCKCKIVTDTKLHNLGVPEFKTTRLSCLTFSLII